MAEEIIIRPYRVSDRQSVRKICCDTADRGEPMESFFNDRKILADMVTSYYTDFEPESTWVADVDGRVVGYLMGCLDTRRYLKIMSWRISPRIILSAIMRGLLFEEKTLRLLRVAFKSMQLGGFKRKIPLDQYAAHMHVDIDKNFRGKGIGKKLTEAFFQAAQGKGVKGIHLSVRGDNSGGRKFFEKVGFRPLGQYPMAMPSLEGFSIGYTVVYGKIL